MALPAIKQPLLVGQSIVGSMAARRLDRLGVLSTQHLVRWDAGVSSGEVTIEIAGDMAYAGTWAPVAVVTFVAAASDPANGLGKTDFVNVPGAPAALRHRVTAQVLGGTVNTIITGSV